MEKKEVIFLIISLLVIIGLVSYITIGSINKNKFCESKGYDFYFMNHCWGEAPHRSGVGTTETRSGNVHSEYKEWKKAQNKGRIKWI